MWIEKDNALHALFRFKDFAEAFTFMTEVAFAAEKMDHHPDWKNVWNRVEFKLNTHSAGGKVTEKDHRLAAEIDRIFARFS